MKTSGAGGRYSKISASLFGCSTARNKGTCANRLNIRRDVLEATILNGLKQHLMAPELVKEFAEAFIREANRLRGEERHTLAKLQSELTRCESRLKRIVAAIADGAPLRTLRGELEELESRREHLERDIQTAPEQRPLFHPNLAEMYRKKLAELESLLSGETAVPEAIDQIRSLVEEIVVTPKSGELRIDLKCDLAAILSIANNKKPAEENLDGLLAQVKLVAGTRTQRESPIAYAQI